MLKLPDVTLLAIDTASHALTARALRDCLAAADFGAVHVHTDDFWPFRAAIAQARGAEDMPVEFHRMPTCASSDAVMERLWYEAPKAIKTSHVLYVHWDSWIINPGLWCDDWLQYDYIGAPWPWYRDGLAVGNGGFSLRSSRLMKHIAAHPDLFPHVAPEDRTLCRTYRGSLENLGFRWAPPEIAQKFSLERDLSRAAFGFHGVFNWPRILSRKQLDERLALATDYVRGTEHYREMLALTEAPEGEDEMSVEYAFHTAVMLMRANRREEAAQICWEVVRRNPKHADAWSMRARIEADEGRHANAMLHHGFALQAAPDRHDLWCNRGIDAMGARMYKESAESFEKSLALQDSYEGHYNYGNLLSATMQVDEAVEQFKLALAIDSKTNPQIHANLGVAMIGQGKWKEGFQAYRHRFNAPGFPPRPRFNYPIWNGEPIDGKTIMLYVEQGFGDEIMGLRFAKTLKDMGARVILAVRPPMYRLARSFQFTDALILMYDPPPWQPDYMCALLDVPAWTDVNPNNMPLAGGYLFAEDKSFRLTFDPGFNIGICWASGKRSVQPTVAETARQKSLTFEQLAAAVARPGVNLVSLQQSHDDDRAMHDYGVKNPMAGVTDFADTAWMIDHLDLVITVDTSVAHLAGAMGKAVWNLVRYDALWPWRQESGQTCWYESMYLYRQKAPYDWREPLERIKADLTGLLGRRKLAVNFGALLEKRATA